MRMSPREEYLGITDFSFPVTRVGKKVDTSTERNNEPTPAGRFADSHRESVREYHERQSTEILFPLSDLDQAFFRARVKDQKLHTLVAEIQNGAVEIPSELLLRNKEGEQCLNLSLLADRWSPAFRKVLEIPGFLELMKILDTEQTLSGEDSIELRRFKEKRKKVSEAVRPEVVENLQNSVHWKYEIVDELPEGVFSSPEVKESYENIQSFAQEITEKLFAAAGLTQFKPKINLTRSKQANAFVFIEKPDVSLQEFLQSSGGQELELPIYIHTGLVALLDTTDELAGVLAHEFSHLLQPTYFGNKANDEVQRLEYDADATGMKLSDAAGYNPRGMVELMKKIRSKPGLMKTLQQFGWGTHPETDRRIIELEKLFNSSDHIFPNGEKKMQAYPEEIQSALKAVASDNIAPTKILEKTFLFHEETGKLDDFLHNEDARPEVFFSPEAKAELHSIGVERIYDEIIVQELVHGTLGYKDMLLEAMKGFTTALQMKGMQIDDNPIRFQLPFHFKPGVPVKELEESAVLGIPKQERYLASDETMDKFIYTHRESGLQGYQRQRETLEKMLGTPRELNLETIQDWLDENNLDAKIFWDECIEMYNHQNPKAPIETLSRGQKLFLLQDLLRSFVRKESQGMGASPVFDVFTTTHQEQKYTMTHVEPSAGVLSKIPLAGSRAQAVGKLTTSQMTHHSTQKHSLFCASSNVVANGQGVHYYLWEETPAQHPPLLQEYSQTIEDKTIETYEKLLQGRGEFSREVLRFILHRLLGSPRQAYDADMRPLLESVARPSISFFHEVLQALESKYLTTVLKNSDGTSTGPIQSGPDTTLQNQLISLVAFALKAKSPAEISLQNEYRRRIELDPMLSSNLPWVTLQFGEPAPDEDVWDTKYILQRTDHYRKHVKQETYYVFSSTSVNSVESGNIKLQAMEERVWDENKEDLRKFLETKDINEARESLPQFYTCDVTGEETQLLEEMVRDFFGKKGKLTPEETQVLNSLGRVLPLLRTFLAHVYEEEILSNRGVMMAAAGEKKYLEHNFPYMEEGAYGHSTEPYKWFLLDSFVIQAAEVLESELFACKKLKTADERTALKTKFLPFLYTVIRKAWSARTVMERAAAVNTLEGDPAKDKAFLASQETCAGTFDGELWFLYRPKETQLVNDKGGGHYSVLPRLQWDTPISYLETLGKEKPQAREVAQLLTHFENTEEKGMEKLLPELRMIAVGNMRPFWIPYSQDDGFQPETIRKVIQFWRLCAELYEEPWKGIEQYKRLDEQMSHWEWDLSNPFLKNFQDNDIAAPYRSNEQIIRRGLQSYINQDLGYYLSQIYKIDSVNVQGLRFSWPLLMYDVWNGEDIVSKVPSWMGSQCDDNERSRLRTVFSTLKRDLERIVDDPDTLDTVKAMQPGFFREFLLAKKLEKIGSLTLDQFEEYREYFTARPHEGTERNQVSPLLEGQKWSALDNAKRSAREKAYDDLGFSIDEKKYFSHRSELQYIEEDAVHISFWLPHEMVAISEDRQRLFYERYQFHLNEQQNQAEQKKKAKEADVLVFSDQVIENKESKLEIGPAYWFRFVAQPLMDWHCQALESSSSFEKAQKLFGRVERNLPERHPLRDVFVKNQMAYEMWHILADSLGAEGVQALGISMKTNPVDLKDALSEFPEYHDIAFLQTYTLYEVEGLVENIGKVPYDDAQTIHARIEQLYKNTMSPDQGPALRRLLFTLEKKVFWPRLLDRSKTDSGTFQKYIDRVVELYPDATFERDEILSEMGMDLAKTPEQIRLVWSLLRAEQMRWPDQKEKVSKRTQHETLEKTRGFIAMMDRKQRVAYLLWTMGGPEPLREQLSSEKTAISLEERGNAIWSLTPKERRELLYDILLGDKGIFEKLEKNTKIDTGASWEYLAETDDNAPVSLHQKVNPYTRIDRPSDVIRYVSNNLFELSFGDQLIDPDKDATDSANVRGRKMLHIIFREMFVKQPNAARRAELLVNIMEATGDAKKEKRELSPGELIKVMLEQVGVVGIKTAQILSEQPGLLPESIRRHLAELKDSGKKVSKQVPATYLQSTGWLKQGDELHCVAIEEEVGVASIKQVNRGVLSDDSEVAIKFKRPSIDKNFAEDMEVVRGVVAELNKNGFSVPGYLINEIEKSIRDELSFTHEVDNQMAMKHSLEERKAQIDLPMAGENAAIPLMVTTPLRVPDILYPLPESEEDVGLIVEQYVTGLSLKDIQKYKAASVEGDEKTLEKMQERIVRLYGNSRLTEIERKLAGLDVDRFQANLGLELMRQIVQGGAFHADLHSGNIFLDFTPFTEEGELYQAKAVLIDLGSAGYSDTGAMPEFVRQKTEAGFSAKEDFRNFLTALFAPKIRTDKIAELVNKYGGSRWTAAKVESLIGPIEDTGEKVKKIFYSILEEGKTMNDQFRYFLKAIATGAGHLDKLRAVVQQEMAGNAGADEDKMIFPKLLNEELLNVDLLFSF